MAHIPVEKKSSPLIWLIPLALLAALLIGGIVLLSDDDDVDEGVEPVTTAVVTDDADAVAVVEEPVPSLDNTVSGTITTVSGLLSGSTASVAGRDVNLSGLKVMEVVGDNGFYVTPVEGMTDKKIFVMLDQVATPNSPIEGRYDVNSGDVIGLMGKAKLVSRKEILKTDDMVTRKELEALSDDMIYLHADKLRGVNETASLK